LRRQIRRAYLSGKCIESSVSCSAGDKQTSLLVGEAAFVGEKIGNNGSGLLGRAFTSKGSTHSYDDD
jgi:hypothetical protein